MRCAGGWMMEGSPNLCAKITINIGMVKFLGEKSDAPAQGPPALARAGRVCAV